MFAGILVSVIVGIVGGGIVLAKKSSRKSSWLDDLERDRRGDWLSSWKRSGES
ncbi:MAG TPA: hypothetical protein VMN76_11410 [Acidobacteriota bacterium]|nr:hypothetical protein [Acidobacteriota bacterium]